MLFQFFVPCVAIALLCFTDAANADVHGPIMNASYGQFPQVVIVQMTVTPTLKQYYGAVVLSSRFAISSPILSDGLLASTILLSGNLSTPAEGYPNYVQKIINVESSFSIIKVCPEFAAGYSTVSLVESDNFNYLTNTTGNLIFYDPTSKVLQYRTVSVLTDADCALDNKVNGTHQVLVDYTAPNMTCTKFDVSTGSCNHVYKGGAPVKNYPLLLIGEKTAAFLNKETKCYEESTSVWTEKSIATFRKLYNMRADILKVALADVK